MRLQVLLVPIEGVCPVEPAAMRGFDKRFVHIAIMLANGRTKHIVRVVEGVGEPDAVRSDERHQIVDSIAYKCVLGGREDASPVII